MGYLWIGNRRWPGGIIPVDLDGLEGLPEVRVNMRAALLDWMHKTEITFVPRTWQKYYLRFAYTGVGASSAGGTGREFEVQTMRLGGLKTWWHYSHELAHTIGFIHEHQRPDRGSFVVPDAAKARANPGDYDIIAASSANAVFGNYDWESSSSYLRGEVDPLPGHTPERIGSLSGASEGDVAATRQAYGFTAAAGMLHAPSVTTRGPGNLEVMARWANNYTHHVSWNGGWSQWNRVDSGPKSTKDVLANVGRSLAPPTLVARAAGTMHAFVRGLYDDVYTATWHAGSWTPWASLAGGESLSPVAAVSRNPRTVDAAVRGLNSQVYTASFDQASGWSGWTPTPPLEASSDITMVAPRSDSMSLFALSRTGRIVTSRWTPNAGWGVWNTVADGEGMFGTSVAAVSRHPNVIDLFAIGTDGFVHTTSSLDRGKTWHGWRTISDDSVAPGTSVTAVARRERDALDLFVVGKDRRMWTAAWDGNGTSKWEDGWSAVGNHKLALRTGIAAVSRRPDLIDVFAVGEDGRSWTAGIDKRQLVGWWIVEPG